MKTFDVQSVGIEAPATRVFEFVAEPFNLPRWASAFRRADRHRALLATPEGDAEIELATSALSGAGTIDWTMTFEDGAVGRAFSRVTPDGDARSVYSFVLMAPPVPLEALEGALDAQRKALAEELVRLKKILESR
jgi:hypothetical protein